MNDFDRAAANAEADLDTMELGDLTGLQVAQWFAENYMTAGHKRLGRILVKRAKNFVRENKAA